VTGIQPMLRLLPAVGTPAVTGLTVHWSYTAARLDLTLAAGTYFVEVGDAYDDAAGTYTFIYQPLRVSTTDAAVAGAPVNGTLNPRGELDLFTFSLAEPTRVVLTAAAVSGIQPMLRLMAGAGAPAIAGTTVHWSYTVARLDLALQPGTYYVEASDAYDDGVGGYTFLYQPAPVVITAGGAACCFGAASGGSLASDALAASLLGRRALLERLQVLHDPADLPADRLRVVVLFRARERVAPDRHVAAVRHGRIAAVNRLRHVVGRKDALVLLGQLRQI
jgi:hypothetical protein